MAKRRRKKDDSIELLVGLIVLGALFVWFNYTEYFSFYVGLLYFVGITTTLVGLYFGFKHKQKIKRSGIDEIDKMTGTQFEDYLKIMFQSQGFHVELTKTTGDYGADLILKKDGKKSVIQAKRYSSKVGIKAVQEVVGAISHYNANEAWVVTNNEFTNAAIKLAESNKVHLVNRKSLINMILQGNQDRNNSSKSSAIVK